LPVGGSLGGCEHTGTKDGHLPALVTLAKAGLKPGVVAHPVISALRRLRQEGLKFQASLGYIARLCLKLKNKHFKTKL
jgi:hypothetical protein